MLSGRRSQSTQLPAVADEGLRRTGCPGGPFRGG
jgi:hypothetical protein